MKESALCEIIKKKFLLENCWANLDITFFLSFWELEYIRGKLNVGNI